MRWKGREQSGNVEDRRGVRSGGMVIGGGIGGAVLLLVFVLLGGDPRQFLQLQSQLSTEAPPAAGAPPVAGAAQRWGGSQRVIRLATGALSLVFGVWLAWQIGWSDGLFRSVAHWSPH